MKYSDIKTVKDLKELLNKISFIHQGNAQNLTGLAISGNVSGWLGDNTKISLVDFPVLEKSKDPFRILDKKTRDGKTVYPPSRKTLSFRSGI